VSNFGAIAVPLPTATLCSFNSKHSQHSQHATLGSVADPGCLSRIPDPDFYPSRIQKQQQKRGIKKNFCHNFLCSLKFHKIPNYFSFEVLNKKIWANFQRIIELFTQKIVTKLSKIGIWDPGSEIRDPQHCFLVLLLFVRVWYIS
jgi:hypothetical protein